MKVQDERTARLKEARQRLWRTWLLWGAAPLVVMTLLALIVAPTQAGGQHPSVLVRRQFDAVLAMCALLFLAGFYLDGRWTDAQRLSRRAYEAAGGNRFTPTKRQLAARSMLVFESIYNSTIALTVIGIAIALAALLAGIAGLGVRYSLLLLALAAEYQVFVLSRHPYYLELMELSIRGELVPRNKEDVTRQ